MTDDTESQIHKLEDQVGWIMVAAAIVLAVGTAVLVFAMRHNAAVRERQMQGLMTALEATRDSLEAARDSLKRGCVVKAGHEDELLLYSVAHEHHIPVPLFYAVVAVESGYRANYSVRGKRGEKGRVQIRPEYWRCKWDPRGQLECAARILRACYERFGKWSSAVGCYNRWRKPNPAYTEKVARELGRIFLKNYDASQE